MSAAVEAEIADGRRLYRTLLRSYLRASRDQTVMRAEITSLLEAAKQSIGLLRRHL